MSILFTLLIASGFQVCISSLVANYQLWNSWGNLLYDFSGSANHASLETQENSLITLTDRGHYLLKASLLLPDLAINLAENQPAFVYFWYLPLQSSFLIAFKSSTEGGIYLNLDSSTYITMSYLPRDSMLVRFSTQYTISKNYLDSWNFMMFRIERIGNDVAIQSFDDNRGPFILTFKFTNIEEKVSWSIGDRHRFEGYLYEVWILQGDTSYKEIGDKIRELNQRIEGELWAEADPYRNSRGDRCSEECKKAGLSCYNEDTNTCIELGQSKCENGCYDILNQKRLLVCPDFCVCHKDSDICISCLEGYTFEGNACSVSNNSRFLDDNINILNADGQVIGCKLGFYLEQGCKKCPESCKDCYLDQNNTLECSSCIAGNYLKEYKCDPCPDSCKECNDTIPDCTLCIRGYYLSGSTCIKCPQGCNECYKSDSNLIECTECGVNYYLDQSVCQSCQAFCDTCEINILSILECTLCTPNYYVYEEVSGFTCLSKCPNEYYASDTSPPKCEKCDSRCLTCTNLTFCTSCKTGFFLLSNTCIDSCGIGYYPNVLSSNCDPCSSNCNNCDKIGDVLKCLSCDNYTYLENDACYSSCNLGYYANSITRECDRCSNYCITCEYSGDILICKECNSPYLLKEGACAIYCGSGYYSDPITKKCIKCIDDNCEKCGDNLVCTQCLAGLGLQTISSKVICGSCPERTYLNSGVCVACIASCKVCSNTSTCIQCDSNSYLHPFNFRCYCSDGYAMAGNICALSPTFTVLYTSMSLAGNLLFTLSDKLNAEPPLSQFSIMLNSTMYLSNSFNMTAVTPLRTYSLSMQNKSLFIGIRYAYIYFPTSPKLISRNNVELSDSISKVPIISQFSQESCSSIVDCKYCYSSGDVIACSECIADKCRKMIYPYPCSICCEDGYYMNPGSKDCYMCDTKCATCDNKGCLSCKGLRYLLNRDCVFECGLSYYENIMDNKCMPCVSNCLDCTDGTSCTRCSVNYVLSGDKTPCNLCPTRTYYDNGSCFTCRDICETCADTTSCSTCIPNADKKSDNLCYCKLGYIYTNNNCIFTEFHAYASLDSSRNIILKFEKPLQFSLISSEISFLVSGSTYLNDRFSFLEMISRQVYQLRIFSLSYDNLAQITLNLLTYSTKYAQDQSKLHESSIIIPVCPLICSSCESSESCTGCESGYYLKGYSCIQDCGSEYVKNPDTRVCQACPSNCNTCGFISSNVVCSECKMGFGLQMIGGEYKCLVCPDRKYLNSGTCLECPKLCRKCVGSNYCTTCDEYAIIKNNVCECDSGNDYIINSNNDTCILGAQLHASASIYSLGKVSISFSHTLKASLTASSIKFSITNEFQITELEALNSYDITFNSITYFGNNELVLYFLDRHSILDNLNFFLAEDSITIPVEQEFKCPDKCLECEYHSNELFCTKCFPEYYSKAEGSYYQCYVECPLTYYPDYTGSLKECKKCMTGCDKCTEYACFECMYGMFLLEGKCFQDCGDDYVENIETKVCDACPSDCKECKIDSGKIICTRCHEELGLQQIENEYKCLICPERTFLFGGICLECPLLCKKCSKDNLCTECDPDAHIINGICECDIDYMMREEACIFGALLHANASISDLGKISISFSDNLKTSLTSDSIQFSLYDQFQIVNAQDSKSYIVFFNTITYFLYDEIILTFKDRKSIINISDFFLAEDQIKIRVEKSFKCPKLCSECNSPTKCTICDLNSILKNSLCVCDYGNDYIPDVANDACINGAQLHAFASIKDMGNIILTFSQSLKSSLKPESISFSIFDEFDLIEISSLISYRIVFKSIKYFLASEIYLYFKDRHSILDFQGFFLAKSSIKLAVEDSFRCPSNCSECQYQSVQLICNKCYDGYFSLIKDGEYSCIETCPLKHYPNSKQECKECIQSCDRCIESACIECSQGTFLLNGSCVVDCGLDYIPNHIAKTCDMCEISHCLECEIQNGRIGCRICEENYVVIESGGMIVCEICTDGKYYHDRECRKCKILCKSCLDETLCYECKENSSITDGVCSCDFGFEVIGESCIRMTYKAYAEFKNVEEILLQFEKPLGTVLDPKNIELRLSSSTYYYTDFIIEEITPYQDYIINIKQIGLSKTRYISIVFKNTALFVASDGSYLDYDTIDVYIPTHITSSGSDSITSDAYVSQSDYLAQDPQAQDLHSKGSRASRSVTGSAVLLSLTSVSSLWFFINSLQMFSLIPLLNVDLPIMLFAFLSSLRGYCPFPNLMEYLITVEDPKPTYRAGLIGYKTSLFLYNSGEMITTFGFSLFCYATGFILKLIIPKKYSDRLLPRKLSSFLEGFRWNMFIRFFIESYIELSIAAALQVLNIHKISNFESINQIINVVTGGLFMVNSTQNLVLFIPLVLMRFIHTQKKFIYDQEFMKKWDTLFQDIKPTNPYFYSYFLLWRLIQTILFFGLSNYPPSQCIFISLICWAVIFI
jgi:hypothetical protein